ncbi:MAG: hypothetical protein JWM98_3109 [Thermoleophilia bacterium]|nr:hypothetical protein [Thermoleophilia bacterium]
MRILVSGARGMIGSAVVAALEARGDQVGALSRSAARGSLDVTWDPASGSIDRAALAAGGFDAVVHLAGEPLLGRWNDDKRAAIRESRVGGTGLLATALAELGEGAPRVFAVARATGWYGDRGEELLVEDARCGAGFLASVVESWEAAADPAREAGIRTVHVRMGVVQARGGGALKAQLTPFRLGAGGRVGSGRQWLPWIGLEEVARVWLHVLDSDGMVGAVNAVGPTPCRNSEYAKSLGRVLHRPSVLPAPVPLMKLALGRELIDEMLLTSQKVAPARLEGSGYEFLDRTIEACLRRELGA